MRKWKKEKKKKKKGRVENGKNAGDGKDICGLSPDEYSVEWSEAPVLWSGLLVQA